MLVGCHGEHLVQLDHVAGEAHPRSGKIEAPHPGLAGADLRDGPVPVVIEVGRPVLEGQRIVLAQVLRVPDLEALVLDSSRARCAR